MKYLGKIACVSIIFVIMVSFAAFASSYVPGSEQDPVVTLSYINAQIEELKEYIDSKISNTGIQQGETNSTIAYEILNLQSGNKLIGKENTEIILRAGEATAIDNGADGISDLTEGKDLRSGDIINKNHLLLVPRDDGRGITAVTEIWVMVKGSYKIQ